MSEWQDLDREIGAHNAETGEYVVRRRQRRPIRNDKDEVVDWEYRWHVVGIAT